MDTDYVWLNEPSKIFLQNDYLINQTISERITEICREGEKRLKKPGFADRFHENIKKGWYSLSTPIWTNFGNDRGLPISCVTGDAWINVGGGKQARDIKVGDEVKTHKGRYRKVTDIMVTENRSNIYKLNVTGLEIFITENHLVLTDSGWVRVDKLDISTHKVAVNPGDYGLFPYIPIIELKLTDKVETVYDFTVEEDHSFVANGVVLHNCFGSYISDDTVSILGTHAEVGMMTKYGGGTSAYFGNLRGRGEKIRKNGESDGSVHFMRMYETLINVISQGKTRRGNFAPYLPVDHKDILEFLSIKSEGNPLQDLSFGITVSDAWMESMIEGDKAKRKVWAKVLECRANTGFPYVIFIDNANKNTVDVYQDKGMKISHSNLCTEIFLPDSVDESFVCDLSSMNILHYDAWKDTDAIELLVYFLDAVMSEFIEKASLIPFMERPVKFATRHRAIGIGWIGWHSYLQSKMIAFESMDAKWQNMEIAKNIKTKAYAASAKMAKKYGEPEVLVGYGRRHATLLAIAPTKSSSFIMGTSESIEPQRGNYCIKDLAKGKFTIKNPYLEALLEKRGENKPATWDKIMKNSGSVQGLPFLTEHEKDVFKTFAEISPKEIIIQASQRQKYIDQGQSLNLMIHPSIPIKDVNNLMIEAWRLGIKSLYYQISVNAAQNFSRNIMSCKSCES